MRIYVDIDGTITNKQTGRSFFKNEIGLREDVIAKVKKYHDEGHEIILWTGNTKYAQQVAAVLLSNYNIKVIAAVGKPDMIIDNEKIRFRRKLKKRVILPEEFLNLP
jgi:hydroxymethylpyrimidine pyrophosphatase-like HAD family hydrolase